MTTVCETCGDVGYEDLLLSCSDCKCAMHQYCLANVLFDGSSLERWFCNQCLLRRGEVTYEGSLHKASNHAHSSSAVHQASTTSVESTKETRQYRNHKNRSKRSKSKSCRKIYSSSKNSLLRKHTQERSDMRPVGDKANRVDCNASNVSCASGKTLHSCEVNAMEISKATKDENQQVDDEHSVRTINTDCVANRLLTRIDESNLQKPLEEFEPPPGAAEQLNATKDSNCMSSGDVEIEYPKGSCVTQVSAMEMQNEPSTLLDRPDSSSSETTLKQDVLLEASDTVVELSNTVQNCVKNNPLKRRQLIVLDDDDDGEDNCVKNNPLKRRQLIVLDDDDDGEEAADVKSKDLNHRSLECDGSLSKHRIDTEEYVEETVHTENLNGQNLSAVKLDILIPESSEITQPVKKLRRYIEVDEDDEDGEVIVGTSNVECALNRCMHSQPIDEPIWSGILKINNGVFVPLAAHISSKACGLVWELSTLLQPVVEVIKLPQLEAWPKSWKASGPTDGDIALYFFPPSMSPNEESDVLVEEIIDSGAAIKAVVGVAELLIFPSTILPEQYHVCQGKHYLWGVFKRREDESHKDVLVEEQDASALAEEREIQEHHFMDQQYEKQCESPDKGTSVVKHAIHVEDRLLTEHNCEARNGATKATMGEGLVSPGSNSPFVKLNLGFMQPRSDPKLHAPERVDHQEDEQNFTRPSADLGSTATTAKSVFSVEPGEVLPTTQLFGFVAARTPRAQQLIQEMVSEGALLFSAPEEIVTVGSTVGNDTEAQVHLTPDGECPPMQERCQSIGFVPLDDDVASDACLELFPVRQEHIGWTPMVEASKKVDLDLSLSARSGAPLGSFL